MGDFFDDVSWDVFFQIVLFKFELNFFDVVFGLEQVSVKLFGFDNKLLLSLF